MNKFFNLPIRVQLLLMVLIVAFFAVGIIFYTGVSNKNERIKDAMDESRALSASIASQQQTLVSATEQLMVVLGQMPEVRSRDAVKTQDTLGDIIALNPQYSTIFMTNLTGEIWASALPTKSLKIGDRDSFAKALSSGHFSSGQYRMGQYSGKQVLSFYYPYKDNKGEMSGVVILGIDLNYHKELIGKFKLPHGSNYLLLDHKGIILSGGLHDKLVGEHFAGKTFDRMKEGPPADTFTGAGDDGIDRYISYCKLQLAGEQAPYMYVVTMVPVDVVLTQANLVFLRNMAFFMTSLFIVLFFAWVVGKRSITDRVALLETASRRLAGGDLQARASDIIKGGELGELALRFDQMANQIASRERALHEKTVEQATILENAIVGIAFLRDRRFAWVNQKMEEMFGYGRNEIEGMTTELFYPSREGYEQFGSDAYPVLYSGGTYYAERTMKRKDGSSFWCSLSGKAVGSYASDKNSIWVLQDITERTRAEEALRSSEEFIRSILDNVDEGFLVVDRDYRILSANKAYCRQSDVSPSDVLGKHCFEISHKILTPCYEEGEDCAVRRVFETGEPHSSLHNHKDTEGNILYVETKAFPLKDLSGAVVSAIETVHNITERRLLEEEQLKTQKLEAIGTLAGGIAHDFNNLLQGVFGYLSLARLKIDQKDEAIALLVQAEQALTLSTNLTSQLLTFSKGGMPAKKKIDIRQLVENATKFALSGSRTDYRLAIADDLWSVEADEGQIAQVVQNIVINASQSMPEGGTVDISVDNLVIAEGDSSSFPGGGDFVRIVISDSGIGIPAQYLSKIFDPYFTTKQKGSGLGLATSYSIVKNHGGVIEVTSIPGSGSIFMVCLPAIGRKDHTVTEGPAFTEGRKGRILVMDDEAIIRDVARKMLESLGHEVGSASDGEEAIESFKRARDSGRPFDIVILDLTVKAGMGGEAAIRRLLEIDPDIKAVVSSGYADNPVVSDYRSCGFVSALNKPYRIDELRVILNELL